MEIHASGVVSALRPSRRDRKRTPQGVRVFVVEDDPGQRQAIVEALCAHPELNIVGTCGDGERALMEIQKARPHVVLLDLQLPTLDGIELTAQVKHSLPRTEVVIWTIADDERRAYEAIRAGASGYLVKRAGSEEIRTAIHQVMQGGTVIEPLIARRFWGYFQSIHTKHAAAMRYAWKLTEAEREILQYLAKGLSNAEVGSMLSLGRRSIRTRLTHIYRKMGVRSHVEAVVLALRSRSIEV
jgi:DNA-binding NarL/FixJ family response regulator